MNRVRVNLSAVAALARDPQVLQDMQEVADAVAERMRQRAPRDTGAGAASIRAEFDAAIPGYRVGWDEQHFYLGFYETGTEHQPARPFARPTADEFTSRR